MLHLLWHGYKYFPYERMLAQREAQLYLGAKPKEVDDGLLLDTDRSVGPDAHRLTYFKAVKNGTALVVPDQARLEASGNGNHAMWDIERHPIPKLSRQTTRYSAHGLHEYRGKFNPQIVRAIGNLFRLKEGAWVLDPFCGSGTTLLESAHVGWNSLGIDINPLGVLIANAKITAFNMSPTVLQRECDSLVHRLGATKSGCDWRDHIPEPDYMEKWFPLSVLKQLRVILSAIAQTKPIALKNVFRVILSDICRNVSLQDPGDLRIRRRKDPADDYPAVQIFIDALQLRVASIVRARRYVNPKNGTTQLAIRGDTREAGIVAQLAMEKRKNIYFDGAITSPPYATAMPYLDTQRLSLALLGMIPSRELRNDEKKMIGNREIQEKERTRLEGLIKTNASNLPVSVIAFCRKLSKLANHGSHGFRRRNVPALVYKYLDDMSAMFSSVLPLIRTNGRYALLVGRNSTELRGEEIVIDTPQLLADVAISRGWKVEETLSFETYHRFDIHQNNSIREEVLLVLRRD